MQSCVTFVVMYVTRKVDREIHL